MRDFPIMGCNIIASIPWDFIAPHEAQALSNHGQTLKRLAERGGLCVSEAIAVVDGSHWGSVIDSAESDLHLINKVRAWRAEQRKEMRHD